MPVKTLHLILKYIQFTPLKLDILRQILYYSYNKFKNKYIESIKHQIESNESQTKSKNDTKFLTKHLFSITISEFS